MSHSGVPGASLLSSNPSYNPLGTFGTLLPDLAAAGGEIIAPGNPLSTAAFLTKGGFDLSQGNILPGLLNFAGAVLPGVLSGTEGSAAGADTAGAAATTTPAAAGSSLSDFLGSNLFSGVGNSISTGFNNVLNSLGLGGAPAAGGTGGVTAAGSTAPITATALPPPSVSDFTALSPSSISELASSNPAGTAAINAITGGPAASSGGGILSSVTDFTKAHPFLTQIGGLAGAQLLSPLLSQITGGGQTAQEKALLQNAQATQGQAQGLINSLTSGTLPPGAQQSVQQALDADIAQIKSRYAAMGISGSAAEQTDIANAQNLAASNKFQLAQTATNTGLTELGLTDQIYQSLVQNQLTRQGQLSDALSRYMAALGTGTALAQAKAA